MYVTNMMDFADIAKGNCSSDYKHEFGVILSAYELEELHRALDEWVASNNIVKVNTVAQINSLIDDFLEDEGTEN